MDKILNSYNLPEGIHKGWSHIQIMQYTKTKGGYDILLKEKADHEFDGKKMLELFYGSFVLKYIEKHTKYMPELIYSEIPVLPGEIGYPDLIVMLTRQTETELAIGFGLEIVELFGKGKRGAPEIITGGESYKIVDFIWSSKGQDKKGNPKFYKVPTNLVCFNRYNITSPLDLKELAIHFFLPGRIWPYDSIFLVFNDKNGWRLIIIFPTEYTIRIQFYSRTLDFISEDVYSEINITG